jgi:hypothetical protein
MTTLRAGLVAPRHELPDTEVLALRRYLDGQSRVHLACWVGHEHERSYDDHLLLGIGDDDWRDGDLRALELGLENELPPIHAWIDLFALSDAASVRGLGHVVWERRAAPSRALDTLDFRLTYEPAVLPPALRDLDVEASQERLWKGERVVRESLQFAARPNRVEQVTRAIRAAGLGGNFSVTAGCAR